MNSQLLPHNPPQARSSQEPDESRPCRILVVEDEQDTAETMSILLRLYGYEVHTAADGAAALALMRTAPPDVILLDLGLPRMGGLEVARRIREQSTAARPLLVAITGFGTDADRVRSYQAGIDLHLTKPVHVEELLRFLKKFQTVKSST